MLHSLLALCWLRVCVISPPSLLVHVFCITPFPVRAQPSLMYRSAESCPCYSLLNPSLCVFCTAQIHILYFCRCHPFKLLPLLHQSIAPYHLTLPGTSNVRWQMTTSTCRSTSCAATDDEHVGECSPLQTPFQLTEVFCNDVNRDNFSHFLTRASK